MAEFPYHQKTAKVRDFLTKIQTVGVPEKVTHKYIVSIGFKSSNDRSNIPRILRFLGLTDSSNVPTERWETCADPEKARTELASAIRKGYWELFQTYPDAQRIDRGALMDFFKSRTDLAESTVTLVVRTFSTLCELADFGPSPEPPPPEPPPGPSPDKLVHKAVAGAGGITINLNIQLTLPDTKDETLYDRFFESLKKHLLQ